VASTVFKKNAAALSLVGLWAVLGIAAPRDPLTDHLISARAVGARLWNSIWMVEKEDGDLLVWMLSDIDTAVNALRRLIPTHLSRLDRKTLTISAVAVFDGESIPAQDDRYAMERVAVPPHRLAGCETQSAHERRPTLEQSVLGHR
jgi:hypothetical protein